MKTEPSLPAPPRLPEFAHELAGRIAGVRAWRRAVVFTTAGALALATMLTWVAVECALDFLLALPWWIRALCFLTGLGGPGLIVWRCGVRVVRQQPTDETVALMIERALPAFRSRFIAAVQLARGPANPLAHALVAETTAFARTLRLGAAIDTGMMWRAMTATVVATFIGLALWFAGGENSAPLLRRAVLSTEPVPRRTKLHMLTGNHTIAFGDDFKIEAGVSGAVPLAGRLHVRYATGRAQDLPIEADSAHRTHFTRTLASVPESFAYFVSLGDARSEMFHVEVQLRPAIVNAEATQKNPAYTNLPPRRGALDDLKLLAGSRLALRVKVSTPVRSGAIRLVANAQPLAESALTPDANDASQLTGEIVIPAKDATGMTLSFIDADGLASRAMTVYRIAVVPDRPPTVKIRRPDRREELLTPGATMLLALEAKDDFGLAKIRLHYAIDWTEGASSHAVDLDPGSNLPREAVRYFDWKIGKLHPPVSEGQVIDYWLEADDAQTPAGIGTMEHFHVRVVSEFEKRADLASRGGDTVKSLDEVRRAEEEMNAKLGATLEESPTSLIVPDVLRDSEVRQQRCTDDTQALAAQLSATLGEYERNRLAGEDVDAFRKTRDSLDRLSAGEMPAVVDLLQKARAVGDASAARKGVLDASAKQKLIIAQLRQLVADHGRQQEGFEFSHAFAQLANRQATNLQKAIDWSRQASAKRTESAAAAMQVSLDEQTSEQTALAGELKSVAEKIAHLLKEPGHVEMAQRFQPVAAEALRVQSTVDAAAVMLKQGQIYKAGVEEKTARDILRRLAKQLAPPQSPAEALRVAERELGQMMTEETSIAADAQQTGEPENLPALENRQGNLAVKCDLFAQDLLAQAPNAAQVVRSALEKMHDTRAAMLDKVAADVVQNAQAVLANLEKARSEIAQLATRAAAPSRQPAASNIAPPAQQLTALEKQADALAKITEAEQRLELETAKIIARALPNMNEQLKGLDVRQADLRAQTGDVKAALAGDPADAVEALADAGRDMGVAKSQLELPDGIAADATERKILPALYRALEALNRKIARTGEQFGGNDAAQANALAQTSAQIAQAQAALVESQRDLEKVEAAEQAGQANVKAMQQVAATLTQAAQQAGKAAAEARVVNEAAWRAMQTAAQDAADGAAQATAGRTAAARAKADAVRAQLAQAVVALALEQAGLAAIDPAKLPGQSPPAVPSSAPATPLSFAAFPPRDRATIEQAQAEKYPAEYGALVEQYLRNLAGESARK